MRPPGVDIRRATPADAAAMARLWEEFTGGGDLHAVPGRAVRDAAFLTEHIALLAEERDEVVGTAYANLGSPHFGFVFGLYTRPAARRRGIATALMAAIAVELRDQGRPYVVLSVDTPNEDARAFYERLGFLDAGRTLRAETDQVAEGARAAFRPRE